MTGRPTRGPLPEGSPRLQPAADRVLAAGSPREVLAAHAARLVVAGTDGAGRSVVVKVDRSAERHHREVGVLQTLRAAGVGVPAVIATDRSNGQGGLGDGPDGGGDDGRGGDAGRDDREGDDDVWVLVLERLAGQGLTDAHGAEAWAAVGEELARLHAIPFGPEGPPFAGQQDGGFADHLAAWGARNRREGAEAGWLTTREVERHAELIGDLVTRVRTAPQPLLHGDCSPQHWLIADGDDSRPCPIDLGDAGVGDAAYDLVVLTLTALDRLSAVLDGYGAGDRMRAHLDATGPGYRALRLAGEVGWLIEHGYDPTPARQRLRVALA